MKKKVAYPSTPFFTFIRPRKWIYVTSSFVFCVFFYFLRKTKVLREWNVHDIERTFYEVVVRREKKRNMKTKSTSRRRGKWSVTKAPFALPFCFHSLWWKCYSVFFVVSRQPPLQAFTIFRTNSIKNAKATNVSKLRMQEEGDKKIEWQKNESLYVARRRNSSICNDSLDILWR